MKNNNLNISKILKKLLFEKEMRPADLAREINMPVPTIHRIVTGKSLRPYPGSLEAISKYLNISVEQLKGINPLEVDENNISQYLADKGARIIPIIAWEEIDNYITMNNKFDSKGELVALNVSKQSFSLIMKDSSMEPMFRKDSTLIFDPNLKIEDRNYILVKFSNTNSYEFRQLIKDVGQNFIKPLNQDISTISIKPLTSMDKIIARLVEVRNKL